MARPAGRGRRGVLLAGALVLIVCAALVGADRLAAHLAENRAESMIQQQLHLTDAPVVQIRGFPFLTQLAQRRFGHVVITADDVAPSGTRERVSLRHVDLDLREVDVTPMMRPTHIGRLSGGLTLTWADLSRLTGWTIGFDHQDATGGWIKITESTQFAGRTIAVTLVARPVLDREGATISLADPSVTVLGGVELPEPLTDRLLSRFADAIVLPLPGDVTGSSLAVSADGVRLGITADDVDLGGG